MRVPMTSREDYLKAIYVLHRELGEVHSVDVANYLGISKPSVCQAVATLTSEHYLEVDSKHVLILTRKGRKLAKDVYEKNRFFLNHLLSIGVDQETAEEDACKMEHAISEESFLKLKEALGDPSEEK